MSHVNHELTLAKVLLQRGLRSSSEHGGIFGAAANARNISNFAAKCVADALSISKSIENRTTFEIKLRMAMHFAPPDAIEYDTSRAISRQDLIQKYLVDNFSMEAGAAEEFSSEVATVLRNWQVSRGVVRDKLEAVLSKSDHTCCACHLKINDQDRLREEKERGEAGTDKYKPYFYGGDPEIWMAPEVDHIEPVSGFGTNNLDNLQLLCRLCNQGKGDALGVSLDKEAANSHLPMGKIKHGHVVRMLFSRLDIDDFRCAICSSSENELTVRKQKNSGPYVLSNLFSVCYDCLSKKSYYADMSEF